MRRARCDATTSRDPSATARRILDASSVAILIRALARSRVKDTHQEFFNDAFARHRPSLAVACAV
jgi:hypothetical protein